MPAFYDQSRDYNNYEPEHISAETAGPAKNLNHGPDCDRCNDAQLNVMENNRRRSATFHQTINNLKARNTDKAIDNLSSVMKRKPEGPGPEDTMAYN
jgi:hypothetical protein